jgi:hypothetical protein
VYAQDTHVAHLILTTTAITISAYAPHTLAVSVKATTGLLVVVKISTLELVHLVLIMTTLETLVYVTTDLALLVSSGIQQQIVVNGIRIQEAAAQENTTTVVLVAVKLAEFNVVHMSMMMA